jgi:hypothetical protein
MEPALKLAPLRSIALACAAALLGGSSCPTTNTGTPGGIDPIDFAYTAPTTIVGSNHSADAGLVGRKEVGLQFHIRAPLELKNVVLSWWPAGNKTASQSLERTLNRSFNPAQNSSVGHTEFIEIPNGSSFGTCEGIYYMFASVYQVQGQNPGLFVGTPALILPTKQVVNGQIQQALCAEPPGPDQ